MPLLASGKIDRMELKKRAEALAGNDRISLVTLK